MKLSKVLFVFLFIFISALRASAGFSGYFKNFSLVLSYPDSITGVPQRPLGLSRSRARFSYEKNISELFYAEAAYDLYAVIQDSYFIDGKTPVFQSMAGGYRINDLRARIYPESSEARSVTVNQNLDRLLISVRTGAADITVGRQAIAWGNARTVNPTDIIVPFAFEDLDTADRRGADAVRVRIPAGALSEVDAGYVAGEDFEFENSAAYLRGRFFVKETDISPMLIGFRENLLAGIDITRPIGGAGVWLETAYVFADYFNGSGTSSDYLRLTAGADYNFSGGVYGFCEYHFNGAGASKPESYLAAADETAYTDGTVYLLAKHYLIPGISWQVTPLLTSNSEVLVNMTDLSAYFSQVIEYNIARNTYISAGLFLSAGKEPERTAAGFIPETEFGIYPLIFYTSFGFYF